MIITKYYNYMTNIIQISLFQQSINSHCSLIKVASRLDINKERLKSTNEHTVQLRNNDSCVFLFMYSIFKVFYTS